MIVSQACGRQARQVSELAQVCVAVKMAYRLVPGGRNARDVERDLHVPVRRSVVA